MNNENKEFYSPFDFLYTIYEYTSAFMNNNFNKY